MDIKNYIKYIIMKFSWKSLSQIIDLTNINVKELADKLVLAGFEIENIDYTTYQEDCIIDIDIPANRTDVECVIGLAKEISIILNKTLNINTTTDYLDSKDTPKEDHNYLEKIFINSQFISAIAIQNFDSINISPSPSWLKNYLIKYDIKPIHNIADIINYVNIKWGQNINIINLQEITSEPFNIKLLNYSKQNRLSESEVIKYNNEIVSLNNLQYKDYYKINKSYSSVILLGIINTDKEIKNHCSENIKCISKNNFIQAYLEASQLIIKLTNGRPSTKYNYFKKYEDNIIKIKKNLIHNILGPIDCTKNTYLSTKTIFNILVQLELQPKYNHNIFTITVPTYRSQDIKRPIDIIEEIGRIYGFDKFTDKIPIKYEKGYQSKTRRQINTIRETLRNLGLHEIINYSLENQRNKTQVGLYNPLLQEQSYLRDNLIENLISTKKHNTKQKDLCIEGFEIGAIFYKNQHNNYREIQKVAGILGNSNFVRQSWSEEKNTLNWFQAKGTLEELFDKIHASIKWINIKDQKAENQYNTNIYKKNRSAMLYNELTQENIGIFGELKTKLNNQLKINHRTYLFEININHLIQTINRKNHLQYIIKPYSYFPSVTRDISIKLTSDKNIQDIQAIIQRTNNTLIESVILTNVYEKTDNNNREKFVCLHITYRAQNRTLDDTDILTIDSQINEIMSNYL